MDKISKKEKKLLKQEELQSHMAKEDRNKAIKKWATIAIIALVFLLGAWWFIKESNKPLPGQTIEDLGRTHIKVGEKVKYNSNPPTSGSHYPDWEKAGIYDTPKQDEYLVHSLEHGYIIISYNCQKLKVSSSMYQVLSMIQRPVFAEQASSAATVEASPVAQLSDKSWSSNECKDLQKELKDIATEQRIWKMIVIPRPSLDTTIALTAWTRIDKMDTVKKDEIVSFIDAFRDKGPEHTTEP